MAKVEFNYRGNISAIQCQENQKMVEISNIFITKSDINKKDLFFVYDGNCTSQFDKNLTFIQLANSFDKLRKKITILVYDKDNANEIASKVKPKQVICPSCNELIKMKIENYKINLFDCKNNHRLNNLPLNEFHQTQFIDLKNIKCSVYKDKSKSITYNNEFYKCCDCNFNLCPLCKSQHNNTHNIINYDKTNFLCDKHGEPFTDYCKNCRRNMCFLCDGEHENHNIISLKKMMINKNDMLVKLESLKNSVIILEKNIDEIIAVLNNLKANMKNYYNLEEYLLNNFDKNQRNYENLYNINEMIKFNNIIINDINNIKNEKDIKIKFDYAFSLFKEMNNSKTGIINIDNNSNNKIKNISNKNEIKFVLKIENYDVNKQIYFLDNTDESVYISAYSEEEHHHDFLKELNDSNVELYINGKRNKYQKYFIPDKKGNYEFLLKFNIKMKNCGFMFYNCDKMIEVDFSSFDTSYVTDMRSMFSHCYNLESIDLSPFNTENVTSMSCMFSHCAKLKKLDLSSFNTKNVKDIDAMFWRCSNLESINLLSFNTENVFDVCWLFYDCQKLTKINISSFQVDNVTSQNKMFYGCSDLKEITLNKNAYNKLKKLINENQIKVIFS